MVHTGPTNFQLQELLLELEVKALQSGFWKRVMKDLNKPARQRRTVNIYKIDTFASNGETILVPGKVLSVGTLNKKVDVAAVNFSAEAREKIINAKGKTLTIRELLQQNPQGKKVRILG
ncbi:MAG: large subunit ribosomal protein L18e [archaeon GW2011_AR9]|nr:MAG: large subunit ribosomal protein L18e [archaeon GW2011_AR9]MBS3120951.1 50S ribosomal protein L18e [Candidatus Woesearchaeota archaeon]HIG92715.1 50S ribosomal protein L18e [Candidatus Woesearchaeota archaeon]HIH13592.1 50S ribosomal protein L18e [Candidatus Woesearchaeota archaeon]